VDQRVADRVVVFSIRPAYAALLFSGEKRFEFRRTRVNISPGTLILVYETRPVCTITGSFLAGSVTHASSDVLIALEESQMIRNLVSEYLANCSFGTAIRAENTSRFQTRISLDDIRAGMRPPQSYCFLTPSSVGESTWERLECYGQMTANLAPSRSRTVT
jgi:predicted transcriptional regulator